MNRVASELPRPAGAAKTLEEFYLETEKLHMRAGWLNYSAAPVMTDSPSSGFVPMHWRYADAKPALDVAGGLIDTAQAERRNLILANRSSVDGLDALRTIMCAYQLILPGEIARAHQHSAHALRVILDAKGSFSIVNGKKHLMETGDIVLTPGNNWHEHGHDGDKPAYWIDILDVPLTCLMETWRFRPHPAHFQEKADWVDSSPFRIDADSIRRGLKEAKADPRGFHGPRIVLENPKMPTLELAMERLSAGTSTRGYSSNANRLFCIMAGSGVSTVGGETFHWNHGDVIAAPAWNPISHHAEEAAQIFSCSDEPILRFANYYTFREA